MFIRYSRIEMLLFCISVWISPEFSSQRNVAFCVTFQIYDFGIAMSRTTAILFNGEIQSDLLRFLDFYGVIYIEKRKSDFHSRRSL